MNESKSFDDIVNSLDSLNENERDAVLHILEDDKIRNTSYIPIKIYTNPYFIILSSIWFVALLAGGVLDIQPIWLRFLLLPLFGIPFAIVYVFELINYRIKKDFKEFLIVSFFVGPILGLFWGLILSFVIFYVWKLIS